MGLNPKQMKILTAFVSETSRSLETMAGELSSAGLGTEDKPEDFRFKGFGVAVHTSGSIEGTILMHLYSETALDLGNKVLKIVMGQIAPATTMNNDIVEALEEWTNTLVGRATAVLEAYEIGLKFEPPFFVHDTETMAPLLKGVQEIISMPIHIGEERGRFYFNYLLQNKTGVAA